MKSNERNDAPTPDAGGFELLKELALDLRSSWNHAADHLWQKLDPAQWELTRNPWGLLQTVSRQRIARLLDDDGYRTALEELVRSRREDAARPGWFGTNHSSTALKCVAYFSMEYMIAESLPIYAGGLGNVAGDQLKAASDLGVPVVAVGLLYQQGYFRQLIDHDGEQQALFPFNDPGQLPVTPVRREDGEWLRLEIALPGYSVWLRAWQVQVGNVKLYLLDSNDAANFPAHRCITSELYGGGSEMRIQQEIILGIGGWRLLRALGIDPEIAHLNEGHAAFAILERARSFMEDGGLSFEAALAVTRTGNLFTTHTAVAAGFDRFSPSLLEQYLGNYCRDHLDIPLGRLLELGRQTADDPSEPFSMAYLAMRGSGAVNGVSRLHGEVSRALFGSVFPRWPIDEVPVSHVTNGVHMPTWDSAAADALWTDTCGKNRWCGECGNHEEHIEGIPAGDLWKFRNDSQQAFVGHVRQRLARQLAAAGMTPEAIAAAEQVLDPNALTLVFARRFVPYKRTNLLLQNRERFIRLLTNPQAPVQLVIAGKAPPYDDEGKKLIREWQDFIRLPEVNGRVVFLGDYDMRLSAHLVQGADVWLNTPLRPWEACGTSGMKVLVNGGINLSVLDGWWEEAYSTETGWYFNGGDDRDDHRNAADAAALYDLLERQVIPEFYHRGQDGLPSAWIGRMKKSMAKLTPRYSAERTVREYTESYYLPLAKRYRARAADKGAAGTGIVSYLEILKEKWRTIRFIAIRQNTADDRHEFEVQVDLPGLDPDWVNVQLYADATNGHAAVCETMESVGKEASGSSHTFRASIPAKRPASDFTARLIPRKEGLGVPLEAAWILWQR